LSGFHAQSEWREKEDDMTRKQMLVLVFGAVFTGAAAYVGTVFATPASGFSGSTIAVGRFGEIDVSNHLLPDDLGLHMKKNPWLSFQKTKGVSDLYVQSNLWMPGGSTGWHTHPGHSLITVTEGTVKVYEGDDPSCGAREYTVGMGFVDRGGNHVHLIRNEDAVNARTVAVQLIPAGAMRRIDADAPDACPGLF
jgi:hypothetical protein